MKRYIYSIAYSLGAVVLLGSAAPAMAQMYYAPYAPGPDFPLHWFVDAGYSATTGQTATYLDDGWNIGGGVQWRPQPGPFSLRGDLSYSRFNGTDAPGFSPSGNPVVVDNGWTNVFNFDVDGVYDIPLGGGVKAYLMAGGGGAYTRMDFASGRFYCGPFGPCGGPSDGTTRWSWNAGAGINFPLYGGQSWFIEARYDKVETQIPGEFVPVRVGFRF
jgi:Outer membrane protein beta-barrel domain